jgi:pantoate--beta-alanine ligase
MKIVYTVQELRQQLSSYRKTEKTIGFVPTMGSLHEGHLSLFETAGKENELVVASIFVNPAQFGPGEDLEKYPRDLDNDKMKCRNCGVDILFLPDNHEIYPEGFVATVVTKLFNMVQPDRAYFGEKDAQQLAIIRRMTADLNMPVDIISCPTIREENGLAKSSRNAFLSQEQRTRAGILYHGLKTAEKMIRDGEKSPEKIKDMFRRMMEHSSDITVEYIEIVEADSFRRLQSINGKVLIGIAVKLGTVRLIDNIRVSASEVY